MKFKSIVIGWLVIPLCKAQAILSFYFVPYPVEYNKQLTQKLTNRVTQPGKIAKDLFYQQRKNIVDGIFCTYAGYVGVSSFDGQVTFPLKQDIKTELPVLITTRITPIMLVQNTVHHFELDEGTQAQMYLFKKIFDPNANAWFWQIAEAELPTDRFIPVTTLTIFASPDKIFIPTGIYLSEKSPHLLLPNMYVKKNVSKIHNALYVLNLKNLFGDIGIIYKPEKLKLLSKISYE